MFYVAKTYQALERTSEPYEVNGRNYIKVRLKNGAEKQVRAYTESEYNKMYPEEKLNDPSILKTPKEVFGFDKGYITIFKGDASPHLDYLHMSVARYCRYWGWYIISTIELPLDLPPSLIPLQLPWELVGRPDGTLKLENEMREAVESLIYEPGVSQWVGAVGDRLEKELVVTNVIHLDGHYGPSHMMIFEDELRNEYVWITATKCYSIGDKKRLRGTIKEHKTYRNQKQTILTRCIER